MLTALRPAPPTFALSRFVEDVRTLVPVAGETLDVEWMPNGRTSLVFRVIEEGRIGDVSVAGPRTKAKFKHVSGIARAVTLQFKPGWSFPVLGVAAEELTDRVVMLEDLWGHAGRSLESDLLEARDVAGVLECLRQALAARAQESFEPSSARLARQAVRLLEGDEVRVADVAKQLGVTARHLRRAFKESIGIGPKEFARTVRLQRALRALDGSGPARASKDWGSIAVTAGYYDQAHLIADFRELVGVTPGAFAAKRASRA